MGSCLTPLASICLERTVPGRQNCSAWLMVASLLKVELTTYDDNTVLFHPIDKLMLLLKFI